MNCTLDTIEVTALFCRTFEICHYYLNWCKSSGILYHLDTVVYPGILSGGGFNKFN